MAIYEDCLKRGIPCHNHYSDLYIPVTAQTIALVKKHNLKPSVFINQVEGGLWYDLPFQFLPYWEAKTKKG